MTERIAVIGLGYVGLPVAVALAEAFPQTVGFDVNARKIEELQQGIDRTREISREALAAVDLKLTSNTGDLAQSTFFVVAVPTPIDGNNQPDLSMVVGASEIVGGALQR